MSATLVARQLSQQVAEFRRFTQSGLADRKVQNAQTLIASLSDSAATGRMTLDEQEALA